MNDTIQTQTLGPRSLAAENHSEWVRLPKIGERLEGLGRSTIYELIQAGAIRSRVLKTHKHAQRGIRLIHLQSLREHIAGEGEG
jgi:hypothetical protein